jgi:hypothetical protein
MCRFDKITIVPFGLGVVTLSYADETGYRFSLLYQR